MTNTNDGGPAFPIVAMDAATGQPINGCFYPGMSLRDWFAGQALAGLLSHGQWATTEADMFARDAYALADAMLRAREAGR